MTAWLPAVLLGVALAGCTYGTVMIRRDRAQRAAGRYFEEPIDHAALAARWDRLIGLIRRKPAITDPDLDASRSEAQARIGA